MRKILTVFIISSSLVACGGGDSKKAGSESKTETTTVDITKDPAYAKGLELEAKNDCKTCHAVDVKITGPAFQEIATKYAGMPDTIVSHLAKKVIEGGSGVWGPIAMTAHAGLPQADAEAIVRYILLFKK